MMKRSRVRPACQTTDDRRKSLTIFAGCSAMLVLAFLMAFMMPLDAKAKKGGGGKGGGGGEDPPTVLPDVAYRLTWLDLDGWPETRAYDMNDSGDVVGVASDSQTETAFLYTASGGMVDLNDISSVWVDVDTNQEVNGWSARLARGINELGQIVGSAQHTSGEERAYFLDPIAVPPQFLLFVEGHRRTSDIHGRHCRLCAQ